MQRRVRHPPAHTRWAEPAPFARKGHEPLEPALLTSNANAAKLQEPASQLVRLIEVTDKQLLLEDEAGKLRAIPRDAVRSVFSFKSGNMVSVAIELSRGLFLMGMQGDKLTLDLDPAEAARVMRAFATDEIDVRLGTKSTRFGGYLIALSLVIGTAIGLTLFRSMWGFVQHLPRPSSYLPVMPGADRGWLAGLAITSMGVVHAALAWLSSPGEMVLGPESLTLKGWLGARTVAYRDIEAISTTWRGFVIELDSEERIERNRFGVDRDRLHGFVDALRERVAKAHEDVPVPSGLGRGSANVTEWRRSLARRARTGDYRVGALDSENLIACVTGSSVPRDVRIGAAIALSSTPEGHDRQRLREVAGDVTHPRLRALYEQLAEGEAEDCDIEALLEAKR